jgi:hypothetical protein
MHKLSAAALVAAAVAYCTFSNRAAFAHGYVGPRLFPATVSTDDPMVADELTLPILSLYAFPGTDGSPETRTLGAGFEFDIVIMPKFSLGIADTYNWQKPRAQRVAQGWDNLTLSLKYEVWRDEAHEAIVSVGLETDLGGTGGKSIGRDPFTTFTPKFYFGKGFGDLPDSMAYLQPLAITGTFGQTFPTEGAPNTFQWGLALEYNLPYLQHHVKDIGIPEPLRDMIPLVEFSMETLENHGPLGVTTGTINPGVLWESRYMQVGVEALIPVNRASGDHIGAMITLEIYIDDLFPKVFGHPIFGD